MLRDWVPLFLFLHVMGAIVAFGPSFALPLIGAASARAPRDRSATPDGRHLHDRVARPDRDPDDDQALLIDKARWRWLPARWLARPTPAHFVGSFQFVIRGPKTAAP